MTKSLDLLADSMTTSGSRPSDADIRPALRQYIRASHAGSDTVVLEELGLCRGEVRADLVVVNGLMHGYEIKSDRDSLRRLATQAEYYGRVFDRATLVIGASHVAKAKQIVPVWWEILLCRTTPDGVEIAELRPAKTNPVRQPRALVEFLWLDQALALLDEREAAQGMRGKPRRTVWDKICEIFEIEDISLAVRAHLKARASNSAVQ